MNEQIAEIQQRISEVEKEVAQAKTKVQTLHLLIKAIRDTCAHEYKLVSGTIDRGTERCINCGDSSGFYNDYGELSVMEYGKRVSDVDLYVAQHDMKKYQQQLLLADSVFLATTDAVTIRNYLNDKITAKQKAIEGIEAAIKEREAICVKNFGSN